MKRTSQVAMLLGIFLLTQFFTVLTAPIQIAGANPGIDDPKDMHLTYQGDPTSTMTITWKTTFSTSGDDVLYDNASRSGDPLQYRFQVCGSHHEYAGLSGYIHDAEINGLIPNTTYYFICGGPGNYSSERAFRTAPTTVSEFRFVMGGDSRTNPAARSEVSEAMSHFNPSFILHVGDMVADGKNQAQWDSWFGDVDANWTGDNGLTIPVIPCLGNHESNSTNYYEQFALPGNEQWYYYDWGPTLRIIVLNSEALDSQIQADQVGWLDNVLSQTPENMWKIVMFHRNIYYAGGHEDERNLRDYWVPLFDKYHVDIVVQGHSHLYHRTKSMNNSIPVYSYREGTMYLTAGAWGAPLHTYENQSYSAYGLSAYHFVLASVFQNCSLHLEAKDINGQTFDSVWLHSKTKYWDFPNGMYLVSLGADIALPPLLTDDNLTVTTSASEGTTSTLRVYCGAKGSPLSVTGVSSWAYDNNTKMMSLIVVHSNATICVTISWVTRADSGSGQESNEGVVVVMIALVSAVLLVLGVFAVSQLSTRKPVTLRRPEPKQRSFHTMV